jgi:tetratricopeptide (TPR) repeat protein
MQSLTSIPFNNTSESSRVFVLETLPGESRQLLMQQLIKKNSKDPSYFSTFVDCNRYQGGPWAGLNSLLEALLPQIEKEAPDLIIKHDYEIVRILPRLSKTISVRHLNLIDAPPLDEPKLTLYPVDRAFRIIHGIIDLLKSWNERHCQINLVVACDNYDLASDLVNNFFVELMRRLGVDIKFTLLVAVNSGNGKDVLDKFDSKIEKQFISIDSSQSITVIIAEEMTALAEALVLQIGEDRLEQESNLPKLIYYWQHSSFPEKAVEGQINALVTYLHLGYYEDALYYGKSALAGVKKYYSTDQEKYWVVCEKLHDCYICLDENEKALEIIREATESSTNPEHLFKGFYRMAMLDTRYLRNKQNLEQAEKYLQQAVKELERVKKKDHEKFYYKAISSRALALIRHLQGQFEEALDICNSTYDQNIIIAGESKYLAHQSLLQFNISRVYISIKQPETAFKILSKAIEIDPEYSEYFNHRGNLLITMNLFEEAINDYLTAVELSPPYPVVWTNLGQCYRQTGQLEKAISAYSRSLDLDPNQTLALVGRAQSQELLGETEYAIKDYTAALNLDPTQSLVFANRAILYYESEDFTSSLSDLDQAIKLSPRNSDLYQNRSVLLIELGRIRDAIQDLNTYIKLTPDAIDRVEVESKLEDLKIHTSIQK